MGSLEGTTIRTGSFNPDSQALKDIGGGESTFGVDFDIVSNPVSGPSVAPPAISFTVHRTDPTFITEQGMHYLVNQPLIQNNGLCAINANYFNESFARPFFTEGTVQLASFLDVVNGIPDAIAGTYTNFTGYSANSENIGYNPQSCADAAASVDPKLYQ